MLATPEPHCGVLPAAPPSDHSRPRFEAPAGGSVCGVMWHGAARSGRRRTAALIWLHDARGCDQGTAAQGFEGNCNFTDGDLEGCDYTKLYGFGGRSFSIFNASIV